MKTNDRRKELAKLKLEDDIEKSVFKLIDNFNATDEINLLVDSLYIDNTSRAISLYFKES